MGSKCLHGLAPPKSSSLTPKVYLPFLTYALVTRDHSAFLFPVLGGLVSKCTSPEGPVGGRPARLLGFQNIGPQLLILNQDKLPNCTGIGKGEESPIMRRRKVWGWDSEQVYQEVTLSLRGTPDIKVIISTTGDNVPLRSLTPSPQKRSNTCDLLAVDLPLLPTSSFSHPDLSTYQPDSCYSKIVSLILFFNLEFLI